VTDGRRIETFNTHRMTDAVVRAVATGRDDELAEIMPSIRQAAGSQERPMPALIVYGERGSGKSFLMRLVEIECASIPGVACVLLPEEQYNIRSAPQILRIVAAHVRGDDWSGMGWQVDEREPQHAWEGAVVELHEALDRRFGIGRGIAVVLLENFDTLTEKLFGAMPSKGVRSGLAVARRQAEERLRKLMNALGGRFLVIATATGTVDMDYERPLFQAFKPVDLQTWSPDTAIDYFNRRRALDGTPPLSEIEEARARAIVEFTSGNPRLAQLLGGVLGSPSAHSIADTLDELVDQLADYYRQRMDALPPAAAGVLDELIRGGEPVSQTGLAARMKSEQRQIADAFSFLVRSRIVHAQAERGGASQLYRVRDRLFVHFYRRRYGGSRGLAPIAELLERFFTPRERELQIRAHLERGEFDEARAFGRLPLTAGSNDRGYCRFRDGGVATNPPRPEIALAAAKDEDVQSLRVELRDHPERAFKRWAERGAHATTELQRTSALVLQAVAASRNDHDQMAATILDGAVEGARGASMPDALIIALTALASFRFNRARDNEGALDLLEAMFDSADRAENLSVKALALADDAIFARNARLFLDSEASAMRGLALTEDPFIQGRLLVQLIHARINLNRPNDALTAAAQLIKLAEDNGAPVTRALGLALRARVRLELPGQEAAALDDSRHAAEEAAAHQAHMVRAEALTALIRAQEAIGDARSALSTTDQYASFASGIGNVEMKWHAIDGRIWLLERLDRYREAAEAARAAIADETFEAARPKTQAAIHFRLSWNLEKLGENDAALEAAARAIAIATAARPESWPQAAWAAHLRSSILARRPESAQEARNAAALYLEFARQSRTPDLISNALRNTLLVAREFSWPEAFEIISRTLSDSNLPAPDFPGDFLEYGLAASARAGTWVPLVTLLGRHPEIAKPKSAWQPHDFGEAGKILGRMAGSDGRAAAYRRIANALPWIERIIALVPLRDGKSEAQRFTHAIAGLVDGLATTSTDAGLLRDVAVLLEERSTASDITARLKAFAAFHDAVDKEAYLQRIDPDLATAIRRIWNVPEPTDTLAKRGRKRSRTSRR